MFVLTLKQFLCSDTLAMAILHPMTRLLPGSSQGLMYKRAPSLLNPELAREDEAQQYLAVSYNPSTSSSSKRF
uniref:Uncharacterized protein n=1 Tax=Aegilops tauschii subsp. strangulata TaxID=200361 RepID=A0A453BSP9_AEGTS